MASKTTAKSHSNKAWTRLNDQIANCNHCPRLRTHCLEIAAAKRRSFAADDYWGRPVPNYGCAPAALLVVGLAPAAHGGNRTGRIFTGDRSGDWLYRALHKAGFANQPHSVHAGDGLELFDCAITAAGHCAPPENKPTPEELAACLPFLEETIRLVQPRVVVALGQIGWLAMARYYRERGELRTLPKFSHLGKQQTTSGVWLLGSYHPSQRSTFTGQLTEPMFDAVFRTARELAGMPPV
jgi:uracil-DNA glycosylase family 4